MAKAKLLGVAAFGKALDKHGNALGKALHRGIREASQILWQEADDTVRIDTGALQASGMWYIEGSGWNTVSIVGYGHLVYGFYDDYGREKTPELYAVRHHEEVIPWFEMAVFTTFDQMGHAIHKEMAKV